MDIFQVKNALSVLPIPLSLNAGCAEVFVLVKWSLLRPKMTVARGNGKKIHGKSERMMFGIVNSALV